MADILKVPLTEALKVYLNDEMRKSIEGLIPDVVWVHTTDGRPREHPAPSVSFQNPDINPPQPTFLPARLPLPHRKMTNQEKLAAIYARCTPDRSYFTNAEVDDAFHLQKEEIERLNGAVAKLKWQNQTLFDANIKLAEDVTALRRKHDDWNGQYEAILAPQAEAPTIPKGTFITCENGCLVCEAVADIPGVGDYVGCFGAWRTSKPWPDVCGCGGHWAKLRHGRDKLRPIVFIKREGWR